MAKGREASKVTDPMAGVVPDDMAAIKAALGANNEGLMQNVSAGPVVVNDPQMPTATSIAMNQNEALGAMKRADVADPKFAQLVSGIEAAMAAKDSISSTPTSVGLGNFVASVPAGTRDIPNSLYYKQTASGKHYVRERADALLTAIFGEDLSPRIFRAAANHGFGPKPLLWVSQVLWEHVNADKPHDFEGESVSRHAQPFRREFDENASSPVMRIMFEICDPLTVKNVSRLAGRYNLSILWVVRKIFTDICNAEKVNA